MPLNSIADDARRYSKLRMGKTLMKTRRRDVRDARAQSLMR